MNTVIGVIKLEAICNICHSFYIYNYFTFIRLMLFVNGSFTFAEIRLLISLFHGATGEASIKSGSAKQADTLPTEPRCTLTVLRRTLSELHCTYWTSPNTTRLQCLLSFAHPAELRLRRTLTELRRTLTGKTNTSIQEGFGSSSPGKIYLIVYLHYPTWNTGSQASHEVERNRIR
jgi:hypothetical protein